MYTTCAAASPEGSTCTHHVGTLPHTLNAMQPQPEASGWRRLFEKPYSHKLLFPVTVLAVVHGGTELAFTLVRGLLLALAPALPLVQAALAASAAAAGLLGGRLPSRPAPELGAIRSDEHLQAHVRST